MSILKFIFYLFFLINTLFYYSISDANNDPEYLKHTCSTNKTFSSTNSAYQSNLHTLLSSLSSRAATAKFYNATATAAAETIYGMFMCRGDITNNTCWACIEIAANQIASLCPNSKEAIIWYHECFVRYSNRSFFSSVDTWPRLNTVSYNATTNLTKEGSYGWLLASTFNEAVAEAANGGPHKKFATKELRLGGSHNVYTLVQCTPDLSGQDCSKCLSDIMRDIPLCCLGRDGGMVLYPSCSLMFGLQRHFSRGKHVHVDSKSLHYPIITTSFGGNSNTAESSAGEQRVRSRIIIIASFLTVTLLILLFAYRFHRIKALRRYKALLKENFGHECTTLESLQFDLSTIEVATNRFSSANMIGKGGYGVVYKGILPDGREVVVKRLSMSSGQGATEFKNEVLLIAKLQHRNLVALLGFCLQAEEKMLIYEYVPNKSLDHFLFDPPKEMVLSWCERCKIIGGIARAILYLHEYSRVKIIHRDIKPSNILLDVNMNPKISDFGMARMVSIDEEQGLTNRIVGTYGYMPPEYAMLGKYSEKSDVFSFGVMILEIISGKKNYGSYESYAEGLLSYAWKQWRDGIPFQIVDPNMNESYSHIELNRCIQVGLLCIQENPNDRPHMTEVVLYLSNLSIELPFPHEPAFFMHGRMGSNMATTELDLDHVSNNFTPYSLNEMSISKSFPR